MPNSQSQNRLDATASTDARLSPGSYSNSVTRSRDGYVKVNEWSRKRPRLGLGSHGASSIARQKRLREGRMRRSRRAVPALAFGLALLGPAPMRAADPEIDRLLQSPVGKDWVTNGGNLTNQR